MSCLADWNSQFEDLDLTTPDKKSSNRVALKTGVCYPVRVRGASLCRSNFGDVQIMIDLDVLDGETGEVVTQHKDWLSLPMQPETDLNKEKNVVLTLTRLRRNVLASILMVIDPRKYMCGEPITEENGERRWLDWTDGHNLSRDEYNERLIEVNRAVIAYSKELHEMLETSDNSPSLEGWAGAELFYYRKENIKKPQYPYSNYGREPTVGLPMFTKSTAS